MYQDKIGTNVSHLKYAFDWKSDGWWLQPTGSKIVIWDENAIIVKGSWSREVERE